MSKRHFLLLLLLLVSSFAHAQYPTSIGTTWQYYQFRENYYVPQDMMDSWSDVVVGDTVAGGNTYQIVRRSGFLYGAFNFPTSVEYDTLDGTYYTRVVGTQVWVLDSVVQGNAMESLLYEFGIPVSGSLPEPLRNLVNLTAIGHATNFHAQRFDNETVCAPGLCDSLQSLVFLPAYAFTPPCSTWYSYWQSDRFLPGIGTIYSTPLLVLLDMQGEEYYLKTLTSNGQVLYRTSMLSAVADAEPTQVQLFPNPATDHMRITSSFPLQAIILMDGLGRTVYSKQVDGIVAETTLELGDLPQGLYWLQVNGETQTATRAVMVR